MKTFLEYLNEKQLNELEITNDTKLYFVGTTVNNFDINTNKFKSYKEFDKISIENSAFGTSTWQYALAYAKQYGTANDINGVIVAFELKPGIEVFDLRNKNEYKELGIPEEIADVFVDAEPYFAINTNIPATQSAVKPVEFIAAMSWLKYKTNNKSRSILDNIKLLNNIPKNKNELIADWKNCYLNTIDLTFKTFYGIKNYNKNKALLLLKKFEDIKLLIDLGAVNVFTYDDYLYRKQFDKISKLYKKEKHIKYTDNILDFINYAKKYNFTVKISKNKTIYYPTNGSKSTYPVNIFNRRKIIDIPYDKWKYRFKAISLQLIISDEADFVDDKIKNLIHNYNLLYNNPKHDDVETIDKTYTINNETVLSKIYGYIKLFEICKSFILQNSSNTSLESTKFKNGLNLITNRLKSKNNAKHIYIDYLQFVFFSLIMQSNKYYGVTCPEIRGYAHIHKFSGRMSNDEILPYGYEKKINASTLYFDDRTVILCKPIHTIVQNIFGHTIDFVEIEDYRKKLNIKGKSISHLDFVETILPKIKECKNVEQYKHIADTYFKN